MAIFSIFQVVSVVVFSLFLVGFLNNLLSDTENECEMTYMFEYPQFVRIKVPDNEKHPQYGLYAYSEGRFTERARKMRFNGIPVLFLPGNVGSYKQVRSLASVALRKALSSSKYSFHFDYFTVDYNDEKSALFGGILEGQTEFASNCLHTILNLYKSNFRNDGPKPTSVIVIGHSMGGVIARALLTHSQNRNIVNLILTLASPHEMPVLNLDYSFDRFYQQIDDQWAMKNINTSNIAPSSKIWSSKVFVSIGGGARDLLVPSALTWSPHGDINILTTAIPGVWLSTDHLCIVWCKQLVLVLNRLLFAIINPSTKQLTDETSHIVNMGKHFLKIGHSKNVSYYNHPAEFIPDGIWHEDSRRMYSFTHDKGVSKTYYYMVRLVDLPENEMVTFEAVDVEDKDWIFGCQAKYVHGQYRVCMNGRHLSGHGYWSPSREGKRKMATLDLKLLRMSYPHWTHILLRVSPTFKKIQVNVDIHSKGSRNIDANIPAMYNLVRRTIIKETQPNALRYNISLPGLDMLYQAYSLYVEPKGLCQGEMTHHASAKLSVPWAEGHEIYDFFTNTQRSPMRVRLLKGNPDIKNNSRHPSIELTLDPQCIYTVSIASSPYDALGQLFRHYATSIPAYLAAIVLLVLRHWAASMEMETLEAGWSGGGSFHSALCGEHVKPYYPILSARLGTMLFISVPFLARLAPVLNVGVTASQNFMLLPLLLYVVALGAMNILGAACWAVLIFSGQLAHKILLRLIAVGRSGGGVRIWEWAASGFRKAPGAGGALLVALATASCGAVALTAGAAFYFFLLTKMYEDYLEDLVYKTIAKVAKKLRGKKSEINGGSTQEKTKSDEIIAGENSTNVVEIMNTSTDTMGRENNLPIEDTSHVELSTASPAKEKNNEASTHLKQKDIESNKAIEDVRDESLSGDTLKNVVEHSKCNLNSDLVQSGEMGDISKQIKEKQLENSSNQTTGLENEKKIEIFSLNPLHFHFAMFFLWCLVTLLNVPALLTWAHNYKYSKMLDPDPSYIPGIIMCASAAVLWQIDAPKSNIKFYDIINKMLYVVAVAVIMVTPTALFRLNYLLSAVFAIITLHQLFPVQIEATAEQSNSSLPPRTEKSGENSHTQESTHTTNGYNTSSPLIEEENDMERLKNLKEKLESE